MKFNKIHLSLVLLVIFTTVSWITSCTHKANIADLREICFTGEVLPIFSANCAMAGCHDGNGGRESRLAFNNYYDIRNTVTPGNPGASRAYLAITAKMGENMMPPQQPLSLESRTIVRLWIEQGADSTVCPDGTGTGPTGGVDAYVARACFSRDILPVIVSNCATTGCHDAATQKEGYNYTTYPSTMKSVRAGNPGNSKLYQVINITSGENMMPPTGQLTTAEIDSIGKWISYGALNETCGEVCDTINPVTFSGTIWPVMQSACTGCHTGASPGGNIVLANYSDVKITATNGSLMNSLRGTGVTKMPKGSSFSACRIRQFEIWINNGSLNN
jgi:hypothetical protein